MFVLNEEGIWVNNNGYSLGHYLTKYDLYLEDIIENINSSDSFILKAGKDKILKFEKEGNKLSITPYHTDNEEDLRFIYLDNELISLSEDAEKYISNKTGFLDLKQVHADGYDYYLELKNKITIIGLMNILDTTEFLNLKDLENDLIRDKIYEDFNYLTVIKSYDEVTTEKLKDKMKKERMFIDKTRIYQTGINEFTVLSVYNLNILITEQMIISYDYFPLLNLNEREILEKRQVSLAGLSKDLIEEEENIIKGYFQALYHKTDETTEHSDRLQKIVTLIGEELLISSEEMKLLWKMTKVHDIGKLAIEGKIINKPGKLSEDEYEIVKKHTVLGYEMLEGLTSYEDARISPLQHHEQWNGNGYPQGLKKDEIHFLVRILTVADSIDAMASRRVYKEPYPFKYIEKELERCQGTQFCPIAAKAALNVLDKIKDLYEDEV